MAVYCMADIHGMQQVFHRMLRRISFSPEDHLYIIGDVIDRGPLGIPLLREIMEAPNMTLLLGNHESMMLDYFKPDVSAAEINRWNKNGNAPTRKRFRKLMHREKDQILSFLRQCPVHVELTVGNQDFYLVHGFPGDSTHDCVWHRPEDVSTPCPVPGKRVIIGHTPIPSLVCRTPMERAVYLEDVRASRKTVTILHTPGFIDIDCGCGHRFPGCALACLRLDDMQEYYEPADFSLC